MKHRHLPLQLISILALAISTSAGQNSPADSEQPYPVSGKLISISATEVHLLVIGNTQETIFQLTTTSKHGPMKKGDVITGTYVIHGTQKIILSLTIAGQHDNAPTPSHNDIHGTEILGTASNKSPATPSIQSSSQKSQVVYTASTSSSSSASSAASSSTSASASSVAASSNRYRIAVLDFDDSAVQSSAQVIFGSKVDVGKGVSNLLDSRLAFNTKYYVVHKYSLNSILQEQNLSNSDRMDNASAEKIGRLLGVDAVIVGSVTQFGQDNQKTGGTLGSFGGAKLGGLATRKPRAVVQITARMINVHTGEVIAVADAQGESTRSSSSLAGSSTTASKGTNTENVNMLSSSFSDTVIGEATTKAVNKLTSDLLKNGGSADPHP